MIEYSDLMQSDVAFDEDKHEYTTPDGLVLSGVTSIIKAVLFPDKYKDVPPAILAKAAKRGTEIHVACQAYELLGVLDTQHEEVSNYKRMSEEHGLRMMCAEYLVSDDTHVATMIDFVDHECNLYDIKTTSVLDEESLSWQLSICAYLFDRQNVNIKAGKLYGIWLRRSEYRLVEVERKTDDEIEAVLKAYLSGQSYTPKEREEDTQLSAVYDIESEIIAFKDAIKRLEEKKETALEALRERMQATGTKRIETDRVLLTLVSDSITTKIDTKRLQAEHPEIAERYKTTSQRKSYVKITIRQ